MTEEVKAKTIKFDNIKFEDGKILVLPFKVSCQIHDATPEEDRVAAKVRALKWWDYDLVREDGTHRVKYRRHKFTAFRGTLAEIEAWAAEQAEWERAELAAEARVENGSATGDINP